MTTKMILYLKLIHPLCILSLWKQSGMHTFDYTDVHIVAVEIIYSALSNNHTHSLTPMFDLVGPLKI